MSRSSCYRTIGTIAALGSAAGCQPGARAHPVPASPNVQIIHGNELGILRESARRTESGALVVVVRFSDQPETPIHVAEVALSAPGDTGWRTFLDAPYRAYGGAQGIARFDSLPAGQYTLRVRAVGFRGYIVPLTVEAGCTERAEVYLPVLGSCRFRCPAVPPPRATLTTCRAAT